ncbi:hypothetical protein B0T10DRAFT_146079 [Thelonectria olida]|uniref:Uncharacterized protein n=1 Tax=Thelonectria olida TaxID=1576542 RepID=A0A9P8VWG4_9HYPO|nr:hypothetical protein B0T10DRAFT_146079 [Thelonectria olida]
MAEIKPQHGDAGLKRSHRCISDHTINTIIISSTDRDQRIIIKALSPQSSQSCRPSASCLASLAASTAPDSPVQPPSPPPSLTHTLTTTQATPSLHSTIFSLSTPPTGLSPAQRPHHSSPRPQKSNTTLHPLTHAVRPVPGSIGLRATPPPALFLSLLWHSLSVLSVSSRPTVTSIFETRTRKSHVPRYRHYRVPSLSNILFASSHLPFLPVRPPKRWNAS